MDSGALSTSAPARCPNGAGANTRKVLNYRTPYEVFFEEFLKEIAT
jgi:hypothetical protein